MEANPKPHLIKEILSGIAMIEDRSGAGSGRRAGDNIVGTAFVADLRGCFLTARHVVKGRRAKEIELRTNYSAME